MDFSSVVLMEVDKDTKHFIKEVGSYEVGEGAQYITKFFYDGEKVSLYFDTNRDVEEWEFSAIYDLFDEEGFSKIPGVKIEDYDEEYNPTWILTFPFDDEHEVFKETLNRICELINKSMCKVFEDIVDKKEEYME